MSGRMFSTPDISSVDWYHPNASRHVAESLLLQNGRDGSYLLRPSANEDAGGLALSVRCKDSVKHYTIKWTGRDYEFGLAKYSTLDDFVKHFQNQPLLAGESGVLTLLKYPYPRDVEEPSVYDSVKIHAEFGRNKSMRQPLHLSVGSKEGYLTKLGGVIKNWKTRWFTLAHNELKYFRDRADKEPVRTLDLTECTECVRETSLHKENCFKLVFPWRIFYMFANTPQEAKEWMELIKWKLENKNSEKT